MREGRRYVAVPDTAPRSVGLVLSCCEGREVCKDMQIQVCANEAKSYVEPVEQRRRTEAVRGVQSTS